MTDKLIQERIVKGITNSFIGAKAAKEWGII